jgi:hypothetical protein
VRDEVSIPIPGVEAPTPDGILDIMVSWTLGHPAFVGVLIVAALVIVAVRAMGGAASGVVGRLTIPIGIVMLVSLAIGATMLFK